jgi:CDGSH-type Zn-finger protein
MESNKNYKIFLKKNVRKSICSCGLSNVMPYCDNSHRTFNENNNCSFKSIKLISDKDIDIAVSCSNWTKKNEKK